MWLKKFAKYIFDNNLETTSFMNSVDALHHTAVSYTHLDVYKRQMIH